MEPSIPYSIDDIVTELADNDQPLLSSRLAELSNIGTEEQTSFQLIWETIDVARQRQIVERLVELAEDDPLLNFDDIFKFCLQDEDPEVQRQAIEGLWDNEEASLIFPLLKILEQGNSEKVQATAATALGKYTLLTEYKKLRDNHASALQEALLKTVEDDNRPIEVRRRALEAVSPLSIPQVMATINQAYESDNTKFKISSLYAMGKNCDPSWLPILLKELSSSDTEIRYEAAIACGELEDEAAVPGLIGLVGDLDTDVVMAALQALGKIGGSRAKEHLEQCLGSTNEVIQQMAEQALNDMETDENPLSFRLSTNRE